LLRCPPQTSFLERRELARSESINTLSSGGKAGLSKLGISQVLGSVAAWCMVENARTFPIAADFGSLVRLLPSAW